MLRHPCRNSRTVKRERAQFFISVSVREAARKELGYRDLKSEQMKVVETL